MNNEYIGNKTPSYYATLIILALIPQIFGFNSSFFADILKIVVLLGMLILLCRKNGQMVSTNAGIIYMLVFIAINIVCLIADYSRSITTIINAVSSVLLIYLFYDCPVREKYVSEYDVVKFFKVFSSFIAVACLYNMITNINQLIHITSNTVYGSEAITSFFDNKNTFGVFLTFGTISAAFVRVIEGKTKWLFLMFVFLINELMAMCRTAIILSMIFLIVSFLIGEKRTRKIRIGMLLGLIIVGVVIYYVSPGAQSFINNNLFGNTQSLDVRDGYVRSLLPLVRGARLIFGYGDEQSSILAYTYTGNRYYHNTYLHLLMSGGLLKLGFFIIVIINSLKVAMKLRRLNRKSGNMCVATIVAYLIYASIESIIVFDTPVIAMVPTIFIITIPRLLLNAETYAKI